MIPWWIEREQAARRRLGLQVEALERAQLPEGPARQRRARVLEVWAARPAAWNIEHAERETRRTRDVARATRELLAIPSPSQVVARVGAGSINAADVIAYRTMWTPYVQAMVNAMRQAAAEFSKAAQGQPSAVDLKIFATPPTASVLQTYADGWLVDVTSTSAEWNAYAGWSDAQVVLEAPSILTFFQKTVLGISQTYAPQLAHELPTLPLPKAAPATDLQTKVIGTIEGYGVLAHGALQLLGIGAGGALETLGAIGTSIRHAVDSAANALPVMGLAVIVVGGLLLARR